MNLFFLLVLLILALMLLPNQSLILALRDCQACNNLGGQINEFSDSSNLTIERGRRGLG